MALAVGGVTLALGAGEATASTAPPPGSSTASVSPNQLRINQQVKRARARFTIDVRTPHPGNPETLTHPSLDSTDSAVGDHTGTAPLALQPARAGAQGTSSSGLLGLDVSGYQGNVNWSQVAAGGAAFAYMKATEGTYYYDGPYFPEQYNGSYAAGLVRGAYHFAIPDNSTGAAQADYFVANGGGWTGDGRTLPGMLDIEYNPYGAECYGLTQSQMVSWISSFDNEYRSLTARWPDIYTTADWWSACTGNSGAFGHESLSIARWSSTPDPLPNSWGTYTIWQYADAGRFPGDQDLFNGSRQALVGFAAGKVTSNQILSGQQLRPGQDIMSANGYKVVMQSDGNLVEYASDGRVMWATHTDNPGAYAAMQEDGNLVVYLAARPLWSTGTGGQGPSYAVIQPDANFVVYKDGGGATWASRGGRIR